MRRNGGGVPGPRDRYRPAPLTGSSAFGSASGEGPTGAAAVGGEDEQHPLRGALLFGNDPHGRPRGSQAVGGEDSEHPLRGALLFGNDPAGGPRGSEAVGSQDEAAPLRGALLFGNDPIGAPRGSEAVGSPDAEVPHRGSLAFGSGHGIGERLPKDDVGYDFGAVMLVADDSSLAGVRKAPMDGLRRRVLSALAKGLDMDVARLRHGLGEQAIKWGRVRDDPSLDRPLAEALRQSYRRAPGEVLGIGQVRDVLETLHRMHTFALRCAWERRPVTLDIELCGEKVSCAEMRFHQSHAFFLVQDLEQRPLAYVDTFVPGGEQAPRILSIEGKILATVEVTDWPSDAKERFRAVLRDERGLERAVIEEQFVHPDRFLARLPDVGRIEDRLRQGSVEATVELDLHVAPVLAWGVACIVTDLARARRGTNAPVD